MDYDIASDITRLNIARAEFEFCIADACQLVGVAQHSDMAATCRGLLVQWSCLQMAADHMNYVPAHQVQRAASGCRLAAIYLANSCNVLFKGE